VPRRNEIITGLFVILGIAVVAWASVWLSGGRWREQGTSVTARFHSVGQLKEGNPVSTRGVTVGSVESIRLVDGGLVDVRMRIRSDALLPDEPIALLQAASLFGDWEATIVSAAERPEVLLDSAVIAPGVIPGAAVPEFSKLTDHTARIAENLAGITDRLDRAISQETADDLAEAISNINQLTIELGTLLSGQRAAFDTLAIDVKATGRSARLASDALLATVARLDSATSNDRLESIVADAQVTAANLGTLSAEWSEAGVRANEVLQRADSALAQVGIVLGRIERGEGSLGRLSADTVLYENTAAALSELRALLDELKTNPDRYFNFSIF
jgi:phospholipid/cholesterol/gamma-HCH transport system substrate-binding protein